MISTFAKFILTTVFFIVLPSASWVFAAVEINLQKTLTTDGVPVDVAVSQDGNLTFVLTDIGSVLIYDRIGNLKDTVMLGSHVDQIEIGPRVAGLDHHHRRSEPGATTPGHPVDETRGLDRFV